MVEFIDLLNTDESQPILTFLFFLDLSLNKQGCVRIKKLFNSFFFTLIASMLAIFSHFFFAAPRGISYITIGTVIAAFIGILPTLSIIPIQRASEAWSPKITEFYKDDSHLRWSLRGIGIISLICFSLETFSVSLSLPKFWEIFLLLGLCGASFDCVAYYYHKVCNLLQPDTACETLASKAEKIMDNYQRRAQKDAKKNLEKEKEFYQGDKFECYKKSLFQFSNELGLIGYKAAINYEHNTVQVVLDKLVKIVQCYAKNRENNFLADPYNKNSDRVIDSIYDDINNIFELSINNHDKKTIEMIFDAYSKIITAFLPISFEITSKNYNEKNQYGEVYKNVLIIGLDGFYKCKEIVLDVFEKERQEINSTFVPLFYLSFLEATEAATVTLSNLQKFCFYIMVIKKFYNYPYLERLEYKLNYYFTILHFAGQIPCIETGNRKINELDRQAISVILDADEWLKLIKDTNNFFNKSEERYLLWPLKTIKQNMEYLKSEFLHSEEEKKTDIIITRLSELIQNND